MVFMAQARNIFCFLKTFGTDRRGNTTVLFALCLPVLIGSAGLGLEAGFWQLQQRQLQTSADMAAYAGAVSLRNNESRQQAYSEAEAEALLHEYDPAVATITTTSPPAAGRYRNNRSMEVEITHTVPRLFSQIFDETPVSFTVRAVATYDESSDACVLALSPEGRRAIDLSGSSNIALIECEIMSNSIAPDAVSLGGSTDVVAPCINSVGGFSVNGGSADYTLTGCAAPRTDLPRAQDPYADVPPPPIPNSCSNIPGGGPHSSTTVTAGAGGVKRFCNGVNINGDVTFEPGVYIIDRGDFRVGANANLNAEGVTFYLTGGARTRFNGSADINIRAPAAGTYEGIAIFADRDDEGVAHTFNGTANSRITGAIYTPAGDISFQGDFSGQNGCMQLVGNTVTVTGNANITTDCSGIGVEWAEVPSDVRLVE